MQAYCESSTSPLPSPRAPKGHLLDSSTQVLSQLCWEAQSKDVLRKDLGRWRVGAAGKATLSLSV